jgi:hypothetical protein
VTDAAAVLDAVQQLVGGDEDADDILRGVVTALVDSGAAAWAGIYFVEGGDLVLGPQAGTGDPEARTAVPVVYDGTRIADLAADHCSDGALLGGVADLVALQCLVGWDTGGVPWDDDPA